VAKNYIKLIYSIEESASMALGEVLGEARGKVAGLKALGNGKIEVSLQGKDQLSGSYMDDVRTFWSEELQFICPLLIWLNGAVLERP
jgi:hypothetical protein